MPYQRENRFIAVFAIALGAALSGTVPRVNALYRTLFANWDTSSSLHIQAFHWPGYVWMFLFVAMSLLVYGFGRSLQDRALRLFNRLSFAVLCLASLFAVDWLTGYMFCHAWGCTKLIP